MARTIYSSAMIVDIQEAKAQFVHLVSLAEGGQAVVITREGKPIARLVPYAEPEAYTGTDRTARTNR